MLRNGPFWTRERAVLDVSWGRIGHVFSSIGALLVGAVLVSVGRFRPSLGPFWRWAVLVGSRINGMIPAESQSFTDIGYRFLIMFLASKRGKFSITHCNKVTNTGVQKQFCFLDLSLCADGRSVTFDLLRLELP